VLSICGRVRLRRCGVYLGSGGVRFGGGVGMGAGEGPAGGGLLRT